MNFWGNKSIVYVNIVVLFIFLKREVIVAYFQRCSAEENVQDICEVSNNKWP